jgi:hypothetical protein
MRKKIILLLIPVILVMQVWQNVGGEGHHHQFGQSGLPELNRVNLFLLILILFQVTFRVMMKTIRAYLDVLVVSSVLKILKMNNLEQSTTFTRTSYV